MNGSVEDPMNGSLLHPMITLSREVHIFVLPWHRPASPS